MKIRILSKAIVVSFIFSIPFLAISGEDGADFAHVFGLPPFVFHIAQFPGQDSSKTRVEINIGLVNDILQFVKLAKGKFKAGYEISLDILDLEGNQVDGKILTRTIVVKTFAETNSREKLNHEIVDFEVSPGAYSIYLDIMDSETHKHLKREKRLTVRDFRAGKISLSSILFLQKKSASRDSMEYNLTQIYSNPGQQAFIRFVIAGLAPNDSAQIRYSLKEWNGEPFAQWSENIPVSEPILRITRSIQEHIKRSGRFTLTIQCSQKQEKAKAKANFSVRYLSLAAIEPANHPSFDDPLGPLQYLLPGDKIKKFVRADPGVRQQLIEDFWSKRDPTPGTPENELKEEFYRRVEFVNKHFSVLSLQKLGWQTDRGRIYIRYGPPNWVRSQSQEFGRIPVEVWYYKNVDKRFFFRDKKENGNFALIYEE